MIVCPHCRTAFETTNKQRRFCSQKCSMAAYYAANRKRIAKLHAAYYAANYDRIDEQQEAYYVANRDKILKRQAARRVAKRLSQAKIKRPRPGESSSRSR